VTEQSFFEQMRVIHERGFVAYTVSELERCRQAGEVAPRSVAITFDDGFASVVRASEIMEHFGFRGTLFIVTHFVATGKALDWFGLPTPSAGSTSQIRSVDWNDVERLASAGWEIGSHTVTHPRLATCDAAMMAEELGASRQTIAQRLGGCEAIAYPYGESELAVANAAGAAGYLVGCTLTGAHLHDRPLLRPRISMSTHDVRLPLRLHLSSASLIARRSAPARAARSLRRERSWLPPLAK